MPAASALTALAQVLEFVGLGLLPLSAGKFNRRTKQNRRQPDFRRRR
jgi:hypothetical protein